MNASSSLPTVLVLGATGTFGHVAFRLLAESPGYRVVGTIRAAVSASGLPVHLHDRLITGIDAENPDRLAEVISSVRPAVVINAIGIVKQAAQAADPLRTLPLNSMLPHRLVRLCELAGARLIHISTDCVFAGTKGRYLESDPVDAQDLYGRSKSLGEVDAPHAITLRTSYIGHELRTHHGLIEWFLAQTGPVRGFRHAVFSGVPTIELARIIRDIVLPRPQLHGLYHVAAAPIAKYDLLQLVAAAYGRSTVINPDDSFAIDRSLDAGRFRDATGYEAAPWPDLIAAMKRFG